MKSIKRNKKVAVVVSRYNQGITQKLLDGTLKTLKKYRIVPIKVLWVPGAFEIPMAVQKLSDKFRPHAVICLGCVLQGATPHNRYISESVSNALMDLSIKLKIPVTFGVLTPNTLKQAQERSGNNSANKGVEAAETAFELLETFSTLNK